MQKLHASTGAHVLTALAGLAILGAAATAAWASTLERNGQIVFRRYLDGGKTTGAIFTMNPNGTRMRQITRPARGVVDQDPD